MKYNIGDRVRVHIDDGYHNGTITTLIIGGYEDNVETTYVVLYSSGWHVKNFGFDEFNIDEKHINEKAWCVCENDIKELITPGFYERKNTSPIHCNKCKKPYPMARPNQEDGTLVCWSCRNGF